MSTSYIDVNSTNSFVKNSETNASWRYKLKEPIRLPANTEVAALSSFINFKGIVGQAIDIKEDIEEEVAFGYYHVDTFYERPVPTTAAATSNTAFGAGVNSILEDAFARINFQEGTGQVSANASITVDGTQVGFTENMMPLMGGIRINIGNVLMVPVTTRVKIVIKKGVYSVKQLSENISDQMNGRKIAEFGDKSSVQTMIERGKYRGVPANNTTTRIFDYLPNVGAMAAYAGQTFFNKDLDFNNSFYPLNYLGQFDNFTDFGSDGRFVDGGTTVGTGNLPRVVAVRPKVAKQIFDNFKNIELDGTAPLFTNTEGTPAWSFGNIVDTTGTGFAAKEYCIAMEKPAQISNLPFSIYGTGHMVGCTGFQLDFNEEQQLFTVQGLAEPRREATNDRMGNLNPDPSKACVYIRRNSPQLQTFTINSGTPTEEEDYGIHSCLEAPMSRIGGCYIFNWGVATAKRLRTNHETKTGDFLKSFQDFFNNEEEAKEAWKETLWFRLGFQYDQFQNTDAWGTSKFYMDTAEPNVGFTTDTILDDSTIPFASTLYSNIDYNQPTKDNAPVIPAGQKFARPNVQNLQVFNMLDVNVPSLALSNAITPIAAGQPNAGTPVTCVLPYNGTFFDTAVMIGVLSSEVPTQADKLPALSTDGYLLITSPTFQNNDQISNACPVCLLDMMPLSALSNQDFVSDKNELIHVLSNEKVIDSIEIRVLRPDLTEPILDTNSSVLIKITTPAQTVPNLLANAQLSTAENAVIQQEQDSEKKASKKK